MRNYKTFTLIILFTFIVTSGFGCKIDLFRSDDEKQAFTPVRLSYWGVWDEPRQISTLTNTFKDKYPTISVSYRKFRYDEYERELLEAWADGRGPDVFSIPATWLKDYQPRLAPVPKAYSVPQYEMVGELKKELKLNLKEYIGYTPAIVKETFIPVVYEDVVLDGKVYALPTYVDTMVTFVNRTLLDRSGIPEPMTNFHELVDQVPKITKVDSNGKIIQSAVSLGGTDNVPRYFDILSNIMLQNGVELEGSRFDPISNKVSRDRMIGAIGYYTDFSNPGKASYSWNDDLPDAFELFVAGKLAYFFGYSYHADQIAERGVSFDWEIRNFPQTKGSEGTKYYANYWVNVVSNKSKKTDFAWAFVQDIAGNSTAKKFLDRYNKPTALRSLIEYQRGRSGTAVYADQLLTADSWYEGYDIDLAEQYTKDYIDDIISGEKLLTDAESFDIFVALIRKTYVKK